MICSLSGLVTYIKTTTTKKDFNEIFYLNLQNEYKKCSKYDERLTIFYAKCVLAHNNHDNDSNNMIKPEYNKVIRRSNIIIIIIVNILQKISLNIVHVI